MAAVVVVVVVVVVVLAPADDLCGLALAPADPPVVDLCVALLPSSFNLASTPKQPSELSPALRGLACVDALMDLEI